jgi:hypothetical protein
MNGTCPPAPQKSTYAQSVCTDGFGEMKNWSRRGELNFGGVLNRVGGVFPTAVPEFEFR